MDELVKRMLAKDTRALARILRVVDDRNPRYTELLKQLFPHTGKTHVIGITGSPGSGKSTLTDKLIENLRAQKRTVAVLAVDPSSPYSGGAILGDRIRMNRHVADPDVFIRSVATRGHLGGLSRSARDMIRVYDAYGFDVVLVETVGVGQDELEITRSAHTTIVVMAPGLGDDIQAIKAGIMESADVFVVNKADKSGADSTFRDIELAITLGNDFIQPTRFSLGDGHRPIKSGGIFGLSSISPDHEQEQKQRGWSPPISRCIATRGEGISELLKNADSHLDWLMNTEMGKQKRYQCLLDEMRDHLREELIEAACFSLRHEIEKRVREVSEKKIDPYSAIEDLLRQFHTR